MQDKRQYDEEGKRHGYWEIYLYTNMLSYMGNYINGKSRGYWEYYTWDDLSKKAYYAR